MSACLRSVQRPFGQLDQPIRSVVLAGARFRLILHGARQSDTALDSAMPTFLDCRLSSCTKSTSTPIRLRRDRFGAAAELRSSTLGYAEKVRPQFLSLRRQVIDVAEKILTEAIRATAEFA